MRPCGPAIMDDDFDEIPDPAADDAAMDGGASVGRGRGSERGRGRGRGNGRGKSTAAMQGFHLNSFYCRNLPPIFCRGFISTVCISEAFPQFFCAVWISTVFISETFFLFSEMKTVEIHTTKKIGIRFLK